MCIKNSFDSSANFLPHARKHVSVLLVSLISVQNKHSEILLIKLQLGSGLWREIKTLSESFLSLFGHYDIKDDWSALSGHTMAAVHSAVLWNGKLATLTAEKRGVLRAMTPQSPNSLDWIARLTHCQWVHVIVDVPVWYAVKALESSAFQPESCKALKWKWFKTCPFLQFTEGTMWSG